jgi:xanthine/CO dehydrogenase XdhC/CoxF family maturation factor
MLDLLRQHRHDAITPKIAISMLAEILALRRDKSTQVVALT